MDDLRFELTAAIHDKQRELREHLEAIARAPTTAELDIIAGVLADDFSIYTKTQEDCVECESCGAQYQRADFDELRADCDKLDCDVCGSELWHA